MTGNDNFKRMKYSTALACYHKSIALLEKEVNEEHMTLEESQVVHIHQLLESTFTLNMYCIAL